MKPTFIPPDPRFDQLATGMHVAWTSTPQAEFDLQYPNEGVLTSTPTAELTRAMSVAGTMQPVVVKRFLPGDDQRDRFTRETEMLSHFRQHPHVVTLIGAHRTETERYIVTERMDTTLADLIVAERPFARDVAVAMGEQLASALGTMHQAGSTHGDVRPDNVGLDAARTTAKLMDFDMSGAGGDRGNDIAGLAYTLGFAMTGFDDPKKFRRKVPKAVAAVLDAGLQGANGISVGDWMSHLADSVRGAHKPKQKRGALYNAFLVLVLAGIGGASWWMLQPPPPAPVALACDPIEFLDDTGPPPVIPPPKPKPTIAEGRLKKAAEVLLVRDELVSRFSRARRGKNKLAAQIADREEDALRLIGGALNGLPPSLEAQRILDSVGIQAWRRKGLTAARAAADAALAKGDNKAYFLALETLYRLDPGDPEARFARLHGSEIRITEEVDAP